MGPIAVRDKAASPSINYRLPYVRSGAKIGSEIHPEGRVTRCGAQPICHETRGSALNVEEIAFPSLHSKDPLHIPAVLKAPARIAAASPVVVIVHGSAGPDSRGPGYSSELSRAGLATLEIDMWTARGLKGGMDRPGTIQETLPDVYGAFEWLAARPQFDPGRIGIMGFSWGGVLSMLTATRPYTERFLAPGRRFAAHAPLYPCCWLYNNVPGFEFESFTGAPIFLQCGELDAYDEPDAGEKLARSVAEKAPGLLRVKTY